MKENSTSAIINNEMIAVELLRALAGCFGLLMSVPITSLTAAYLSSKGNMGELRLHDVKFFRLVSGAKGKMSGAWQKARAEAKSSAARQEKPEEPQINLFEKARQHYDEMQSEEEEKGE